MRRNRFPVRSSGKLGALTQTATDSGTCPRMMKPRILVVADSAPLRATLSRWLLGAGYAVELAESPRHAREVVSKPGIALIIVAPQGFGAAGAGLVQELAGQVEHVIVIAEPAAE